MHDQVAGRLSDVDAVVAVSSMADDPLVLFVEGVHGWPRERNPCVELVSVRRQRDVLPGAPGHAPFTDLDGVPGREPEVVVLRGVLSPFECAGSEVFLGEVRYRIAARFEKQEDVFTVRYPCAAEEHAHAEAQRLDVQPSGRQRLGHEEMTDRTW